MLGGFLHICTCTCTIYYGLWPPDNTSCTFITWYQSLGLGLIFLDALLVRDFSTFLPAAAANLWFWPRRRPDSGPPVPVPPGSASSPVVSPALSAAFGNQIGLARCPLARLVGRLGTWLGPVLAVAAAGSSSGADQIESPRPARSAAVPAWIGRPSSACPIGSLGSASASIGFHARASVSRPVSLAPRPSLGIARIGRRTPRIGPARPDLASSLLDFIGFVLARPNFAGFAGFCSCISDCEC
jgi:hypothetical protein